MVDLGWTAATYVRMAGASISSRAQYRASFALDFVGTFTASFADFVGVLALFQHLPRLGGWSLPEIAFLYGTSGVSFAIADMLIGHLDTFGDLIRTGAFDVLLVRPAGSLYQAVSSEFAIRRAGRIAQAALVLAYALARLHVEWTPQHVALLAMMMVSGVGIFAGVWVAGASISFWTVEIREVVNSFTYGGSYLASFPINVFGVWTRRFLAFVVPTAFVAYYPALLILGRPDPVLGRPWLGLLAPLVAAATLVAGTAAWRIGVRHYRSTGS